jgi:hypothetical protein
MVLGGLVERRIGIGCGGGRGRQKKAPEGGPGLENAMRVALVRRGATQEAYAHPGRGAREVDWLRGELLCRGKS